MTDDRITDLEIKSAYQEDLLQELNNIIARQQQQLDRLQATCKLFNEQIKSLSLETGKSEHHNELPPHY
jgi:SlyX protein